MLVVQPKVTIIFKLLVSRGFFFCNFKYIEIFLYVIYSIKGILKRLYCHLPLF